MNKDHISDEQDPDIDLDNDLAEAWYAENNRLRRLRRLARQQGFELVKANERDIRGRGPYVLIPHKSGMSLDEIQPILTGKCRRH